MKLETFIPSEKLRAFIRCYMIVDCNETIINSMLPDTSLTLGFRYKGTTKYLGDTETLLPFAVVAGLRKSVQRMKDESGTGNLLVIFNTAGAAAFFREPLHAMYGEVLPLDEFVNFKNLHKIEDKLCGAISNQQRIRIVERFLLSKLKDYNPDTLINMATKIIMAHKGAVKIKTLANQLFISVDAFEKRFRKQNGASPKQFSYIVRMNALIERLDQKTLEQTAFDAGYYDQAHFSKDFKLFTGETPTAFLKDQAEKNQ